jgi:hypothetical protein
MSFSNCQLQNYNSHQKYKYEYWSGYASYFSTSINKEAMAPTVATYLVWHQLIVWGLICDMRTSNYVTFGLFSWSLKFKFDVRSCNSSSCICIGFNSACTARSWSGINYLSQPWKNLGHNCSAFHNKTWFYRAQFISIGHTSNRFVTLLLLSTLLLVRSVVSIEPYAPPARIMTLNTCYT